jgi:hypothetical protein
MLFKDICVSSRCVVRCGLMARARFIVMVFIKAGSILKQLFETIKQAWQACFLLLRHGFTRLAAMKKPDHAGMIGRGGRVSRRAFSG